MAVRITSVIGALQPLLRFFPVFFSVTNVNYRCLIRLDAIFTTLVYVFLVYCVALLFS